MVALSSWRTVSSWARDTGSGAAAWILREFAENRRSSRDLSPKFSVNSGALAA
jgi:hypothetical protein